MKPQEELDEEGVIRRDLLKLAGLGFAMPSSIPALVTPSTVHVDILRRALQEAMIEMLCIVYQRKGFLDSAYKMWGEGPKLRSIIEQVLVRAGFVGPNEEITHRTWHCLLKKQQQRSSLETDRERQEVLSHIVTLINLPGSQLASAIHAKTQEQTGNN